MADRRTSRRIRCVFRVAAGPRIGFGHLMRARALAGALGVELVVSLRGGSIARDAARRIGCVLLASTVDPLDLAEVVVIDEPSRRQTDTWVARARRRGIRSVTVVDTSSRHHHADLVVDGSLSSPLAARGGLRLKGPRFTVLDHGLEVMRRSRRARRAPVRILIALGGGQHVRRVASVLVEAIARRCVGADIMVAAGLLASTMPALSSGRWVYRDQGLADLLSSCDVAVVGGGVTLSEACALGTPTVGLAVVKIQRPALRSFASTGAIIDAGGPRIDPAAAARVATQVARLVNDEGLRRRVAARARRLVDGHGAQRVATHIRALVRADRERAA